MFLSSEPEYIEYGPEGEMALKATCFHFNRRWKRAEQLRPMRDACARAGIAPAVGFHVLRHTHASILAIRAVPMAVIARQLGHSDTRMTERHYAHLAPNYVADTIRASSAVDGSQVTQCGAHRSRAEKLTLTTQEEYVIRENLLTDSSLSRQRSAPDTIETSCRKTSNSTHHLPGSCKRCQRCGGISSFLRTTTR